MNQRQIDAPFVMSALVGLLLGGIMIAAVRALFPTSMGWVLSLAKADAWKAPTLVIGSALLILVLYVAARRMGAVRIADALVLGYVMALVTAAMLVIAWELFLMLRTRVPQDLGLKNVSLPMLVGRG
jgi:hypothetical protein